MKLSFIKHIFFSLLLLVAIGSYGQQDPIFTQYLNNPVLINPAYAGSYGNLNFNGIFRKQWVGIDWQPTTTSVSVTSPFINQNVGVGLTFIYDKLGPLSQTGVYTDYAYHIDFNKSRLSLGLKGGFNLYQKNLWGLSTPDVFDPSAVNTSKFLFNTGIGAYYFTENYFVGLSVPKLIRNSLSDIENTYEIIGKEERHYFLTGGGVVDLTTILKLKPSFMLRVVDGSPSSAEVSATLIIYERLWAGAMYRFGDAMGLHARFEIRDGLQVGYSFDLTNSRLRSYNSGTHELFFSYSITKAGRRILSPRYF